MEEGKMSIRSIHKESFLSRSLHPARVFIALMVAVCVWLLPAITAPSNTNNSSLPLSLPTLQSASAQEDEGCVCLDWNWCVPTGQHDGAGGMCCRKWSCPVPTPVYQPPSISFSCTQGNNGWCVGSLSLDLYASDPQGQAVIISGDLNGGTFVCPSGDTSCSIPLSEEGSGTINYTVNSATGLSASDSSNYSVDVTTPQVDGWVSGAPGSNGWYVSDVTLTASASDSTSGIDTLQTNTDSAGWISYTDPVILSDGQHTYRFKATDNAGNITETPQQDVWVDTTSPDISLVEETSLGETLYYEVQDPSTGSTGSPQAGSGQAGSGLSTLRFVIDDEDERFQKVTWEEIVSGNYYEDGILWDGKFKDGTQAPLGTYYLTIKATDVAGNEARKAGSINVELFSFLQNIAPFNPPSPLPQGEGVQGTGEGGTTTIPPASTFGGTITSRSENTYTKTSFLTPGTTNPLTPANTSNILFGAAAAAAVGAFIADAQRKREEEAARQAAARIAGDRAAFLARIEAEGQKNDGRYMSYKERGKAYQASLDNFKAGLIANGVMEEAASQLKSAANSAGKIPTIGIIPAPVTLNSVTSGIQPNPIVLLNGIPISSVDGAPLTVADINNPKLSELASQNGLAISGNLFADETYLDNTIADEERRAAEQTADDRTGAFASATVRVDPSPKVDEAAPPAAKKSWLTYIPFFVGSTLNTALENSSLSKLWDEKIYQPYIKPYVTPKNIAATLLTIALGYNGAQWVNNIATNSHIFEEASANAQREWAEVVGAHPDLQADTITKTQNLFANPYEVVNAGYDATKAFANSAAGYIDALWQANPVSLDFSDALRDVGDQCSSGAGEAWARRCSAVLYFGSGVVENPADSLVWIGTKLFADPTAGAIKTFTFGLEHNNPVRIISDLSQAIQDHSLMQGVTQVTNDRLAVVKQLVTSDPEVQSFLFLAGLVAIALIPVVGLFIAAGIGGLIVGAQTISTIAQIDQALQAAATRAEAMRYAASKSVRRDVLVNLALVALVAFGAIKGVSEINQFRTFQESLPLSAKFELPFPKQLEIYNAAQKLGTSPAALEYYLTESARPGSSLSMESMATGLKYANIYTQIKSPSAQLAVKSLPFPSQLKIFGLSERPIPSLTDPVLRLTPREIEVLTKMSTENYFANYAVLGTYDGGKGYTLLADKADLMYLNMPRALYEFYKDYPIDFKLINKQYIIDLAEQGKPVVLSVDYLTIQKWGERPADERPTTYWEVIAILQDIYHYTLDRLPYSFEGKNYDLLIPSE